MCVSRPASDNDLRRIQIAREQRALAACHRSMRSGDPARTFFVRNDGVCVIHEKILMDELTAVDHLNRTLALLGAMSVYSNAYSRINIFI